jgi:phage shock protein C
MKKLFRIKGSESMLGGVFAGLSEYLNIDLTLLRVIAVALFFTPVPIVILYLLFWVIMPARPTLITASYPSSNTETSY